MASFARRRRVRPLACLPPTDDAPLRHHDLRQRVPALSRPAGRGATDPAMVRRIRRRVDDVPRVLSDRAARGLCVLRSRPCAGCSRAPRSRCTSCCSSPRSPCCRSSRPRTGSRAGSENPLWLILGMLIATIGLPYFLLSTTSPLVQVWFARTRPGASPYRLFALSNLASMLALLGYPFVVVAAGADARTGDRLVGRLRAVRRAVRRRRLGEPARDDARHRSSRAPATRQA